MMEVTIDGEEIDADVVTISSNVPDGTLILTITGRRIVRVLIDHTGAEASKDVSTWEETAEDLWFSD